MNIPLIILMVGFILGLSLMIVGLANFNVAIFATGSIIAVVTLCVCVPLLVVRDDNHVNDYQQKCQALGGHVNQDLCLKPGSEINVQ